MAWGAAATGTPAATGSTGQGLSLMQESLAEITLARLPLVVLDMARAQGDYYQATRGGGHGDYRHIVLSPQADAGEAVALVGLAFDLAERWAQPGRRHGGLLPRPHRPVGDHTPPGWPVPSPDWALDGSSGGSGHAKLVSFLGTANERDDVGYDLSVHYTSCAQATVDMVRQVEPQAGADPDRRCRGGGGGVRHTGPVREEPRFVSSGPRASPSGAFGPSRSSRSPPGSSPMPCGAPGRWPSTRTTRDR